jgi:hypothetical protein
MRPQITNYYTLNRYLFYKERKNTNGVKSDNYDKTKQVLKRKLIK